MSYHCSVLTHQLAWVVSLLLIRLLIPIRSHTHIHLGRSCSSHLRRLWGVGVGTGGNWGVGVTPQVRRNQCWGSGVGVNKVGISSHQCALGFGDQIGLDPDSAHRVHPVRSCFPKQIGQCCSCQCSCRQFLPRQLPQTSPLPLATTASNSCSSHLGTLQHKYLPLTSLHLI